MTIAINDSVCQADTSPLPLLQIPRHPADVVVAGGKVGVGDDFLLVHADPEPGTQVSSLRVYPNPAAETVFFELPQTDPTRQFQLMDALGRTLVQQPFADTHFRFERGLLPKGLYFYRISGEKEVLHTGSIFLKG